MRGVASRGLSGVAAGRAFAGRVFAQEVLAGRVLASRVLALGRSGRPAATGGRGPDRRWSGGDVVPFLPMLRRRRAMRGAQDGLPAVLGRIGTLEVRLAASPSDIRRAQRLRYGVFYEEGHAAPSAVARFSRLDADPFDAICDHLLVFDDEGVERDAFRRPRPRLVGTYRLLRGEVAARHHGFYSAAEFDIGPLLERHAEARLLELGRSCVLKPYRNKRTVELLWHGVWTYVLHHRIDAMFGCASLDGLDPKDLALPLSYLHHHALAPDEWRVRALPGRHVPMDAMPREAVDARRALHALPPLIKGYLRVGATFGDGAVVDRQFGTTDVFVVMPIKHMSQRYVGYFGAEAQRYAA